MTGDEVLAPLVREAVAERAGFLTERDVALIARHDPERVLLIRWHEGRRLVVARAVERAISRDFADWTVRDVSLPSTDRCWLDRKVTS